MSLCPETEFRSSLDDGEFWDCVLLGHKPGDPDVEPDPFDGEPGPVEEYGGPCDLCGSLGACGYDEQGRPLIHPTYVADDS